MNPLAPSRIYSARTHGDQTERIRATLRVARSQQDLLVAQRLRKTLLREGRCNLFGEAMHLFFYHFMRFAANIEI